LALYDCDELLTKLKLRGHIPVSSGSWTDARLLEAASDEAEEWLLPLLVNARGEFLVKTQDIPFVANQRSYRPTYRVAAIRQVSILRADGTEYPLEELNPPQKTALGLAPSRTGQPTFYTWEDGVLTLWPVPGSTGDSVRVRYHYRPNRLALPSDAVTISAIAIDTPSAGYTRFTVSTIPAAMHAAPALDFIRATPNFDVLAFDVAPRVAISTGGTVIDTASSAMPSAPNAIVVGDRIVLARYTPFPNMPSELHLCAGLRAAASAVRSRGDKAMADSLVQEAAAKEASLLRGILAPRSKGNPHRIANRRFGLRHRRRP
jgi:hypothetical protein